MNDPMDESDLTPRPVAPPASPIAEVRQAIADEEWRRDRDVRHIHKRLDAHDRDLLVIQGREGKNGKIGQLAERLSGMQKTLIAVAIAALSALGGAAASAWHAANEAGAEKATLSRAVDDVAQCHADISSLRQTVWSALFHLPPGATP